MNKIDSLQKEILNEFPNIKTLSWINRIKANWISGLTEYIVTHDEGSTTYRQSALLVSYKGKYFFKSFGTLNN